MRSGKKGPQTGLTHTRVTHLQVIDFDGPVDLYHFYLLRAVGKGAFGKVRVVQHKQTKVSLSERIALSCLHTPSDPFCFIQTLYALKYINKAKCIKMRAVSNIIQERRLLEEIESPFVCNLRVSAPRGRTTASHTIVCLTLRITSHSTHSKTMSTCSWCWI